MKMDTIQITLQKAFHKNIGILFDTHTNELLISSAMYMV